MYTYLYYYHYKYTLAFPVYYIYIYIIHVLYHIRILYIVPVINECIFYVSFLLCMGKNIRSTRCLFMGKNIRSTRCLLRVKIYVPLGV